MPPTFVQLELDQFPRPAAEACADNTTIIEVNPGQSIAAALAQATPGTTVLVHPGTYTEAGEVALRWSTDNVCLRAAPGGEVVLQAGSGQRHGMQPSGDDTVIEGFTLRGFASSIGFWNSGGSTLRRVTIERVHIFGGEGLPDGINAYGNNREVAGTPPTVDGLLVLDSEVRDTGIGISCNNGPCAHWWIERTTIAGKRGSDNSGADAFAIEEGHQIVLLDTTVGGSSADGIDTKATDIVVYGCRVLDVARNGIKLWRGGDVIDTVLDGSGADTALAGSASGRYRYLHVDLLNHSAGQDSYLGTWAYDTQEPVQLEIVNSIFASNSSGGFFVPQGSEVSIRHTIFDQADAKLIDLDGRRYMVGDMAEFEAAGHGTANQVTDPALVPRGDTEDFHTQPGSPARDAAERVEGLTRDLDGDARQLGRGPDIGACECDD